MIFADATSGTLTVTLTTAAAVSGRILFIKRTNSNKNFVKIAPAGSETIDGGTGYTLGFQYHSVSLVSDGTNWAILF